MLKNFWNLSFVNYTNKLNKLIEKNKNKKKKSGSCQSCCKLISCWPANWLCECFNLHSWWPTELWASGNAAACSPGSTQSHWPIQTSVYTRDQITEGALTSSTEKDRKKLDNMQNLLISLFTSSFLRSRSFKHRRKIHYDAVCLRTLLSVSLIAGTGRWGRDVW